MPDKDVTTIAASDVGSLADVMDTKPKPKDTKPAKPAKPAVAKARLADEEDDLPVRGPKRIPTHRAEADDGLDHTIQPLPQEHQPDPHRGFRS